MANILLEEAANFHFGLKLWLVINDETINCLRWNAEKTAVIIDLSSFGEVCTLKMFSMQTVEDFLRQLKYNGFERCSPGANESLDSTCVVYRHSAFVLSNEELFRGWLLVSLHTGGFINEFHPRITSDINLLDEQINIRGFETAKEPDAFLDENLNTDTVHLTSLAVDSFLVDKNSILGQNLAGLTGAITEFSNITTDINVRVITSDINLLDEQINIRGSATAKEPDAFLDENLNTDTEHSTSLAVDSFLVDKNSILGQNLAGLTSAIAEFSNIYGSLDSELYATYIQLEPVDTISVDSVCLCMDEETPSIQRTANKSDC